MTKEDISITYENNVFYCTKNGTKWISVDGEKWYGEEKRIKELELELTVEKDQHQEEINLHLHAEDYIKSLEKENKTLEGCLLAEQEHTQMLKEQIEKMKFWHNREEMVVIRDLLTEYLGSLGDDEYFNVAIFNVRNRLNGELEND